MSAASITSVLSSARPTQCAAQQVVPFEITGQPQSAPSPKPSWGAEERVDWEHTWEGITGTHAETVSQRVREAAVAAMVAEGRPVIYLNSGKDDKPQMAVAIAAKDGIRESPICALKAIELCASSISWDQFHQALRQGV